MPDDAAAADAADGAGDREPIPPAIRAALDSQLLSPGEARPPTFEVAPGDAQTVWLQISTDAARLGRATSPSGADQPEGPVVFDAHVGDPSLGIAPTDVRVSAAGTDDAWPTTLTLPQKVWDAVRARRDVVRLYYRVSGETGAGQPLTSSDGDSDTPHLFAHVGHSGIAPDYEPASLPALPALRVNGVRVEQVGGKESTPVVLCGVNLPGLDTRKYNWGKPFEKPSSSAEDRVEPSTRWYEAAGISKELLVALRTTWKANVVRVPVNQDWILNGTKLLEGEPRRCHTDPYTTTSALSGNEYLNDLTQVVAWANDAGLYVILCVAAARLDERFSPVGDYQPHVYQAPLPDASTELAWRVLASRFKRARGVLFDLFNEPHCFIAKPDPSRAPWYEDHHYRGPWPAGSGPAVDQVADARSRTWWEEQWKAWAIRLMKIIGQITPDRVVLVAGLGGPNWGASLRALPARSTWPLKHVVYTAHLYAFSTFDDRWVEPGWTGTFQPWKQAADANPRFWLVTRAAGNTPDAPILVGEWGPAEWPWNHNEGDATWPDCSSWAWRNPTAADGPAKRAEALRDALRPLGLGGDKDTVASDALVGWTAWAIAGDPLLNCRKKVTVKAEQPRKPGGDPCTELGALPVNVAGPGGGGDPPVTPWGALVKAELGAHPPGATKP